MIVSQQDIQVEEDCPMDPMEGNRGKKGVPLEMCNGGHHNGVLPVNNNHNGI